MSDRRALRRARPLLGTLVEIGVAVDDVGADADARANERIAERAIERAFARVVAVQERLSRFDPASEIARFNAAACGACIAIGDDARKVLGVAASFRDGTNAAFDVTLGSGAWHWRVDARGLHKLAAGVRIDLGGIAKGHAVDAAVAVLVDGGARAGWVNAGGDLRAFGALALPIDLRDEESGGVRRFATVEDGAFATSRRVEVSGAAGHASVAAPTCMVADALTKIVLACEDAEHPMVGRCGAIAWLHAARVALPA